MNEHRHAIAILKIIVQDEEDRFIQTGETLYGTSGKSSLLAAIAALEKM